MKNTVTLGDINDILERAKITTQKVDSKTCLVRCELETGFVLYETSSCIDPKNYDDKIGKEICMERITNKLWELEAYRLSQENFLQK